MNMEKMVQNGRWDFVLKDHDGNVKQTKVIIVKDNKIVKEEDKIGGM